MTMFFKIATFERFYDVKIGFTCFKYYLTYFMNSNYDGTKNIVYKNSQIFKNVGPLILFIAAYF